MDIKTAKSARTLLQLIEDAEGAKCKVKNLHADKKLDEITRIALVSLDALRNCYEKDLNQLQ